MQRCRPILRLHGAVPRVPSTAHCHCPPARPVKRCAKAAARRPTPDASRRVRRSAARVCPDSAAAVSARAHRGPCVCCKNSCHHHGGHAGDASNPSSGGGRAAQRHNGRSSCCTPRTSLASPQHRDALRCAALRYSCSAWSVAQRPAAPLLASGARHETPRTLPFAPAHHHHEPRFAATAPLPPTSTAQNRHWLMHRQVADNRLFSSPNPFSARPRPPLHVTSACPLHALEPRLAASGRRCSRPCSSQTNIFASQRRAH